RYAMKKWRITAFVALITFGLTTLRPSVALAYNEATHRNIADWAYRVLLRTTFDFAAPEADRIFTQPPANCQQNPCLQQRDDFLASTARSIGIVAAIPVVDPSLGGGTGGRVPVGNQHFAPELSTGFGARDDSYKLLWPAGSALSDTSLRTDTSGLAPLQFT